MNFQALIALFAGIATILVGGIAVINFLVERGYKARINECHMQYQSRVGIPMTSIQKAASSKYSGIRGRVQRFTGVDEFTTKLRNDAQNNDVIGVSIYSSRKGTFPVWGSIGQWYEKQYGTAGSLGFPTSAEQQIHNKPRTCIQHFEGGKITCEYAHDPTIEYIR